MINDYNSIFKDIKNEENVTENENQNSDNTENEKEVDEKSQEVDNEQEKIFGQISENFKGFLNKNKVNLNDSESLIGAVPKFVSKAVQDSLQGIQQSYNREQQENIQKSIASLKKTYNEKFGTTDGFDDMVKWMDSNPLTPESLLDFWQFNQSQNNKKNIPTNMGVRNNYSDSGEFNFSNNNKKGFDPISLFSSK